MTAYTPLAELAMPAMPAHVEDVRLATGLLLQLVAEPETIETPEGSIRVCTQRVIAFAEGVPIGVLTTRRPAGSRTVDVGTTLTSLPGQGVGLALYLAAARLASRATATGELWSYGQRSADATRCWERLVAAGLAQRYRSDGGDRRYVCVTGDVPVQTSLERCAAMRATAVPAPTPTTVIARPTVRRGR